MPEQKIQYFVFDIESVADGKLISTIHFPDEELSPNEAIQKYRKELLETRGSDFIPYTFQLPVSLALAKIGANFELIDLVVLDEPQFRPHIITQHFWQGWQAYKKPTLVTFNGRTFDVPLLELAAFRYGISVPEWFRLHAPSYEQPRNRYNTSAHFDLQDLLTNFGATRFNGGLNLAANLLGKPGKMRVQGDMVQDMFHDGKLAEINDYCRCDVLDTYFLFLRSRVMLGQLSLSEEQALLSKTKRWVEDQSKVCSIYQEYLENWGHWENPWSENH
ncbi:MAG: 3'-5' exonuclease [Pirellulaceae bacterium]|nr:3'-5' exonuclease [Pirellulaceae bacterium]